MATMTITKEQVLVAGGRGPGRPAIDFKLPNSRSMERSGAPTPAAAH